MQETSITANWHFHHFYVNRGFPLVLKILSSSVLQLATKQSDKTKTLLAKN